MLRKTRRWLRQVTFAEVMIVVAILGIIVAMAVTALGPGPEEDCRELCEAMRHRTIKLTRDACVCEDPETGERHAHPRARLLGGG